MASGAGDAGVREGYVDPHWDIYESIESTSPAQHVEGILSVKNSVLHVLLDYATGTLSGVGLEVVIVCFAKRWNHISAAQIDYRIGCGRRSRREHTARHVHRASGEPGTIEPLSVDERYRTGVSELRESLGRFAWLSAGQRKDQGNENG